MGNTILQKRRPTASLSFHMGVARILIRLDDTIFIFKQCPVDPLNVGPTQITNLLKYEDFIKLRFLSDCFQNTAPMLTRHLLFLPTTASQLTMTHTESTHLGCTLTGKMFPPTIQLTYTSHTFRGH